MSTKITAALKQLNQATGKQYTIDERRSDLILRMDNGGQYPPCTGSEMVERLVRMTIAARGRVR